MNPNTVTTAAQDTQAPVAAPEAAVAPQPQVQAQVRPAQQQSQQPKPAATKVQETAAVPPAAPTDALAVELAQLRSTITPAMESYLGLIEKAARRLSIDGVSSGLSDTQHAQNEIFVSLRALICNSGDHEFNAVMYTIADIFKRESKPRSGGLSRERVFAGIGDDQATKTVRWAPGRNEAELAWFRTFVVAMHAAHERGATALKAMDLSVLYTLPAIAAGKKDKRLQEWFKTCNPLNAA